MYKQIKCNLYSSYKLQFRGVLWGPWLDGCAPIGARASAPYGLADHNLGKALEDAPRFSGNRVSIP
jgi:hypothetical protein